MGRLLLIFALLIPLIEIALFVVIGGAVGVWATVGGVVLAAIIGSLILRWQGLSMVEKMRSSLGRAEVPGRKIADAMMITMAGLLLVLPGYFSDFIGILLLLPPVRAGIYALLRSRVQVVSASSTYQHYGQPRVEDDTIELSDDEYRPR